MGPTDQNKLLYGRAGFGMSLKDYAQPLPKKEAIENLFSGAAPKPLYIITQDDWMYYNPKTLKGLNDTEKRQRQQDLRKRMPELNLLWLSEMVQTQNPLLEKMSLFWHGHFACRIDNPYYAQMLLNNIRTNALGSFRSVAGRV